jgi:hypothetical protein
MLQFHKRYNTKIVCRIIPILHLNLLLFLLLFSLSIYSLPFAPTINIGVALRNPSNSFPSPYHASSPTIFKLASLLVARPWPVLSLLCPKDQFTVQRVQMQHLCLPSPCTRFIFEICIYSYLQFISYIYISPYSLQISQS